MKRKVDGKWYCPKCQEFKKSVMLGICMDCGSICRFFKSMSYSKHSLEMLKETMKVWKNEN
ncbi:hypothetical protein KAX02_11200 [candidate division WOR-3 bacterium]|nr:hypothetical protein [candidate division WOR-3 bacterium]